jgi:hypothetical protein
VERNPRGCSFCVNNLARFRNAEFDGLYQRSKRVGSDSERTRLYERMARIVGTWSDERPVLCGPASYDGPRRSAGRILTNFG